MMMRQPKYRLYMFLTVMPFIVFIDSYILFGDRVFSDWRIWAVTFPMLCGGGYLYFRFYGIYDNYIRRKLPSLEVTARRVFLKLAASVLFLTPLALLLVFFFDWFHVLGYELNTEDLEYVYFTGLAVNALFESLWEVMYILDKYKEAAAEKELIEQLQLQQEFDNLKQKVNPHFLFNSFNTLSSLIAEDKHQAEKFLDELSKVYRYLLTTNDSGISTVEQEIAFINSYYKLLKTRYGAGFDLQVQIDPKLKDHKLPSLSLQLLVENAVKHNVISKTHPVHIVISSTDDALVVENNLNKKTVTVESTGIGLSNIKEKYKLLNRDDVRVEEGNDTFRVTIPLLA